MVVVDDKCVPLSTLSSIPYSSLLEVKHTQPHDVVAAEANGLKYGSPNVLSKCFDPNPRTLEVCCWSWNSGCQTIIQRR